MKGYYKDYLKVSIHVIYTPLSLNILYICRSFHSEKVTKQFTNNIRRTNLTHLMQYGLPS